MCLAVVDGRNAHNAPRRSVVLILTARKAAALVLTAVKEFLQVIIPEDRQVAGVKEVT